MKRDVNPPPALADTHFLRQAVMWEPSTGTIIESPRSHLTPGISDQPSRSTPSLALDTLPTELATHPSLPSLGSSPASPTLLAADASASRVSLALPTTSRLLTDEQRRAAKKRNRHSSHVRASIDASRTHRKVLAEQNEQQDPPSPDPAFGSTLGISPAVPSVSSSTVPAGPAMSSAAALAAAFRNNPSNVSLTGTLKHEPLRACDAVHARLQRAAARQARKDRSRADASTLSLPIRAPSRPSVDQARASGKHAKSASQNVSYRYSYVAESDPQKKAKSKGLANRSPVFSATTTAVNEYEGKVEPASTPRLRHMSEKSDRGPKVLRWVRKVFG